MDNCTAHTGPIFDESCAVHNVTPIFLPPHASNQLQMLDLCIFGVTNRHIAKVNELGKTSIQTTDIHRIRQGFYSTAMPANTVASFRNDGASLVMEDGTNALLWKWLRRHQVVWYIQWSHWNSSQELAWKWTKNRKGETGIRTSPWKGSQLQWAMKSKQTILLMSFVLSLGQTG
jgi:hypothetical protein